MFCSFMKQLPNGTNCLPVTYKTITKLGLEDNHHLYPQICDTMDFTLFSKMIQLIRLCKKPCKILEYHGTVNKYNYYRKVENSTTNNEFRIDGFFATDELQIHEEYLIYGVIEFVGIVGGTLGLFIGYSFNDYIKLVLKYLERFVMKKTPQN